MHKLLSAPLHQETCTGHCPSPEQCLLLPGQIGSSSNCKQWRRTDNNTRAKKCPTIANIEEKKYEDDEKKWCKNKEMDRAREITRINIGESFQRRREMLDL